MSTHEARLRASRNYQAKHRQEVNERNAAWREANPEAQKRAVDAWNAAHPDRVKAKGKKWKQANPDAVRASNDLRRARLAGVEAERVVATEIFERDDYTCQICFESIDPFLTWPHVMSASLDHIIPISKGGSHTRANTQASHLHCNVVKGDR